MEQTSTAIEVPAMVNPHSHLREGDVMGPLVRLALQGGVDTLGLMPNTEKGLHTAEDVTQYMGLVKSLVPPEYIAEFIPYLMMTEETGDITLDRCMRADIHDIKVYPRGRTTKSNFGVEKYHRIIHTVCTAGVYGIRVHLHPEHPWLLVPNRDAEYLFLPIARMLLDASSAVIFWEHGSDARCIPFWKEMARTGRFYVTLTAHHLATDEDAVFGDVGATCKPPIKTRWDREQLVQLVAENHPWVIAGADDAPHDIKAKHVTGRCACGAYTAPFLLPLYAHALSSLLKTHPGVYPRDASDVFVNFTSRNARKVFGLPPASRMWQLIKKPFTIPASYEVGPWKVEPFWAGQTIDWSLEI
ncbi:MAG: dihydroorotase [Parcubacteria group bacterium Gr01-1014_29]|nr:MAG: dihydroorotase [Parcubacteria group bacterium Gr01-1014_29]